MGLFDLLKEKEESNHLEFVKEFEYENKQLDELNRLLELVGDDERERIEEEIYKMKKGMSGENNVNYYLKNTRIPGFAFHNITI